MYPQIIDANINRIAEGLRVIEEYTRFIVQHEIITQQLSVIRKKINLSEKNPIQNLMIRNVSQDVRAAEVPQKRQDIAHLLKANFKRVEEGLRVLEEYTGEPLYNQLRYEIYMIEKEIFLYHLKPTIKPGIYLISHDVDILEQGLKWNVSLIQLRDKEGNKQDFIQKARYLKELTKAYQTPLIINDHIDVAQLIDADGFHSGQDDLSVEDQRLLLGPHKIIGKTTHSFEQGLQAKAEGADYVSVGPIWETPSKPGREGIGFDYLNAATKLKIPYVAIGGISLESYEKLVHYHPPLIGIVRAHQDIPELQKLCLAHSRLI
ncbi:MAG: thiamine phosphate synthase [Candidatus Margulisbacteria bacterium]|nr:thiamine phosphate synthase [Candidatus Margulisiibacteriota bacterium]